MRNKIYKISFILLFMLFTTGLYNYCFAYSISTDAVINNTATTYLSGGATVDIPLYKSNVSYIECPTEHTYKIYMYSTLYNEMRCYVSNNPLVICCTTDWRMYLYELDEQGNRTDVTADRYVYNFSNNTWSFKDTCNGGSYANLNLDSTFLFIDYTQPVLYGLPTAEDTELIQIYPEPAPSTEELITNCDFKVNFKFMPEEEDIPYNTNLSWHPFNPYRLIITHSLTNWSNYNVKFSFTQLDEPKFGRNVHFDLYNLNGERLIDGVAIEYNKTITNNLSDGDFIYCFGDNAANIIKLNYDIYDKDNNLLLSKEYKFKFTKNSFTTSDDSGTILEETTKDNNGEIIEDSKTGFETNGYDNTNNSSNNNYYDVSNINSLLDGASDTISLTQKCFAILPGFIWTMVGVFLSVIIALRILGR